MFQAALEQDRIRINDGNECVTQANWAGCFTATPLGRDLRRDCAPTREHTDDERVKRVTVPYLWEVGCAESWTKIPRKSPTAGSPRPSLWRTNRAQGTPRPLPSPFKILHTQLHTSTARPPAFRHQLAMRSAIGLLAASLAPLVLTSGLSEVRNPKFVCEEAPCLLQRLVSAYLPVTVWPDGCV